MLLLPRLNCKPWFLVVLQRRQAQSRVTSTEAQHLGISTEEVVMQTHDAGVPQLKP